MDLGFLTIKRAHKIDSETRIIGPNTIDMAREKCLAMGEKGHMVFYSNDATAAHLAVTPDP